MIKSSFSRNLLSLTITSILSTSLLTNLYAADIPAGTQLDPEQKLVFNNSSNPATLDPQKMEGDVEGMLARQLFETLVTSDEKGNLLPGAAQSWEHSADFKTWTFNLRKDAKWSNGDPVVAGDFVFGFERLVDPKTASPYASYLDYLKIENANAVIRGEMPASELGVEAKDDYTLVLHLSESVPFADKLTEHYVLSPANPKVVAKYGDKWTLAGNLVGNGAFKLKKYIINEKIVLERNHNYWNDKKTSLNEITMLPIEQSTTDVARYRAGGEDMTGKSLPSELYDQIKKDFPEELYVTPILCTYLYEFNTTKAPFNNEKVRQALKLSIDRNIITDKILKQGQIPAYGFTPPYINGGEAITPPAWAKLTQKERNEQALKLLSEAGFSKSNPLDFTLLYNTSDDHKKLAIAASSMWKKNLAGAVNVKLENQEWKTYLDSRHQGNFDVARAGWCADYNEATTFLNYYLSNSSNNTAFYKSKAYDDTVAQSYKEDTNEARAKDYAKAEQILDKDAPFIPVYSYVQPRLIKPYVKGFAHTHPGQSYYLKDVYIVKH